MSIEFYKKYRPRTLDAVVGCETTVSALAIMIANKSVPHAVLFHGPAGGGKTTMARILANELKCKGRDFNEMNSANYRGIDSVRAMQRDMNLSPTGSPCRVWLLDEAHKLSNDAQNAALKMLEDTPAHVYFFLCTTEPDKLINAIRTRCTDMPVRRMGEKELKAVMAPVLKAEKVTLAQDVEDELLMAADGSARQLLVMLEKIASLPEDQRVAAIRDNVDAAQTDALALFKALIDNRPWKRIAEILRAVKAEPEEVRWAVLGLARHRLLKDADGRAFEIIDRFDRSFYDNKAAGLAAACWQVVHKL